MPFFFTLIFGSALLLCAVCLFIAIVSARQNQRFFKKATPLMATLCSFAWLLLALLWHGAFGPDYSALRYTIIALNLFGMLAAAVTAAAIRSQRSWPTVPAASILAIIWLYIGAISSVA
jgi:hypothetical protein